jgi:ketosteroid isomerase-like protein
MLDAETVNSLERHWEDGWNGCDVDTIMAPLAEDVVFVSPFVARLTGDAAQTSIHGHDALRDYVADAVRRAGDIRYRLDATYAGSESVILAYTCRFPDGSERTGADSMRTDASGKVVDWRCHYTFDAADVAEMIRA